MTRRPEGRRRQELSDESTDDGRFGHYLVFEDAIADLDAGNESAGIDVEIPGLPRPVEGDDDFFEWKPKGAESDVGTVGPGTDMIGVEGY